MRKGTRYHIQQSDDRAVVRSVPVALEPQRTDTERERPGADKRPHEPLGGLFRRIAGRSRFGRKSA